MAMQKQKTANARARLACEQEIETLRKARSGERFVYESEIWRIGRRATINRLIQEINRKRHGNAEAEDGKR